MSTAKSDRLLMRVERLVLSIKKIDATLDDNPDVPNKERLLERRGEYQNSLSNIQKYGSEKKPSALEGVTINIPTDILNTRSH